LLYGLLILRLAHVVVRLGLSMTGAICATFVAALLMKVDLPWFDTIEFSVALIVIGMIGAYLGINIPRRWSLFASPIGRSVMIDLLSAVGTFIAAGAGLVALYSFVLDEASDGGWNLLFGFWWALGVSMQITAGLAGRLCTAKAGGRY
jgi:hypothetical protein